LKADEVSWSVDSYLTYTDYLTLNLAGFFLPVLRALHHFLANPFVLRVHELAASVLTTVSSDTEPTVVVAFDPQKYIFMLAKIQIELSAE